jgi:hypothetical protein
MFTTTYIFVLQLSHILNDFMDMDFVFMNEMIQLQN